MNTDIRLSVGFWENLKTHRLEKQLGESAIISLLRLWCWVAQNKPDGVLNDMGADDIEMVAKWGGDEGLFVEKLVQVGFLDCERTANAQRTHSERTADNSNGKNPQYLIHDWRENNPWAAEARTRSDKARFSKLAQVCPEVHSKMVIAGDVGISKADYEKAVAEYNKKMPAKTNRYKRGER